MRRKTMILSTGLALLSGVLASGLTLYADRLFLAEASANADNAITNKRLLLQQKAESEAYFFDVNNVVITLTSSGNLHHYLLLDLALKTDSQEQIEKVRDTVALIKGATVNLLTHMSYESLNAMPVETLRQRLLKECRLAYQSHNLTVPFSDIVISQMIFQ